MSAADAKPRKAPDNQFSATIDLVKQYAVQETVGPLKGAGKFLGIGAAGAVLLGLGVALTSLGVLRLLQSQSFFRGNSFGSVLAYVIALFVCALAVALAAWRIKNGPIQKEGRP
jgi:hypothetical protein